jgi:hypothetical protein
MNSMGIIANKGLSVYASQQSTGLVGLVGTLKIEDKDVANSYTFAPLKEVPIEVLSETPHFLTCKVLPHINPSNMGFGASNPYNITVDKFDLFSKKVMII